LQFAEEGAERRLAAILAAEVVGYSRRLMERDEAGTLAALRERRKGVLTPLVGEYHGHIVKVMGDGVFAVGVTFLILARRPLTSCPAPQEVHVRAR
jgi:class 3 adenylate cyclase